MSTAKERQTALRKQALAQKQTSARLQQEHPAYARKVAAQQAVTKLMDGLERRKVETLARNVGVNPSKLPAARRPDSRQSNYVQAVKEATARKLNSTAKQMARKKK